MPDSLRIPGETPPAEGSTAEAHVERPDGGIWDHPLVWLTLVVIGCGLVAGYFLLRAFAL